MDVHALAGLYSCQIQSFEGYIQSLNPNLTYALTSLHLHRCPLVDIVLMTASFWPLHLVLLNRWMLVNLTQQPLHITGNQFWQA